MISILDQHVAVVASLVLGDVVERSIQSNVGPCRALPDYITTYPDVVVQALGNLYAEYNQAFAPLVEANREWATDYHYNMVDKSTVNWGVQIDMVGLPQDFLNQAASMPVHEVQEILRYRIFEIENSLAMYQLLEKVHAREGCDSFFKLRFRRALAALKKRTGKPIALLAVTDQKYRAMKESEFGVMNGVPVSDAEVAELSGFDRFFGPEQFKDYLASNGGKCGYLLYARTSDPVAKLKDPGLEVEHPLLGDPEMLRLIKANAITFNVDDPLWQAGDHRRINDTKAYMAPMGMAFGISDLADLLSVGLSAHLLSGKQFDEFTGSAKLSRQFIAFLVSQGVNPAAVAFGNVHLRAKPLKGTFGCYGHVAGSLKDGTFRSELKRNIRQRGEYVVQVEMPAPSIINTHDGVGYKFMDRNFMAIVNGKPRFLGGLRMLMPVQSVEAKKGRIHGNENAVVGEVICSDRV